MATPLLSWNALRHALGKRGWFRAGLLALALGPAAIAAACSLNPQPLPPGATAPSGDGKTGVEGDSGTTAETPTADAAAFGDSGGTATAGEAGPADLDAGNDARDGADALSDSATDASDAANGD